MILLEDDFLRPLLIGQVNLKVTYPGRKSCSGRLEGLFLSYDDIYPPCISCSIFLVRAVT